jgi:hypothetical protein
MTEDQNFNATIERIRAGVEEMVDAAVALPVAPLRTETTVQQIGGNFRWTTAPVMTAPAFPPIPTERPALDDRLAQARREHLIPPQWMIDGHVPFKYGGWDGGAGLCLLFHIPVTIREVLYYEQKYMVPAFKLKTSWFLLGLPINPEGKYLTSQLHVVSPNNYLLPHVDVHGACLGIADATGAIKDIRDYRKMAGSIKRAMEQINLGSLFTTKSTWPKEIRQALPIGTRGTKSELRRTRFNVAIKKYFTEREAPEWTLRDNVR